MNRKPITLDNLDTQIKTLVNPKQGRLVIVNADEKVDHGKVVAVMDRLRTIPGVRLAIATEKLYSEGRRQKGLTLKSI